MSGNDLSHLWVIGTCQTMDQVWLQEVHIPGNFRQKSLSCGSAGLQDDEKLGGYQEPTNIKAASVPQCSTHHQYHFPDKNPNNTNQKTSIFQALASPSATLFYYFNNSNSSTKLISRHTQPPLQSTKMHCTIATLLSVATFSLGTFARPQPADSSIHLAKRYATGRCNAHVVQYQKNEGPSGSDGSNSEYRLDVTLMDGLDDVIGGVSKLSVAGGNFVGFDSQLPSVFEVEVGANDAQPLRFMYAGQGWSTDSSQCSVGDYDSGSRQLDCGFTC